MSFETELVELYKFIIPLASCLRQCLALVGPSESVCVCDTGSNTFYSSERRKYTRDIKNEIDLTEMKYMNQIYVWNFNEFS